jgi:hypothetical protein
VDPLNIYFGTGSGSADSLFCVPDPDQGGHFITGTDPAGFGFYQDIFVANEDNIRCQIGNKS